MTSFRIHILGNNSALPAYGRMPSAQVINVHERFYMIDCGEGCQMQFRPQALKPFKLEAIFISHLHGDHFFGLFGLLNSMSLMNRSKPLRLYAHEGLRHILEVQFKYMKSTNVDLETAMTYPIEFVSLPEEGLIHEDNDVRVHCFPLDHKIDCCGFLFQEKQIKKKLNIERLTKLNIPKEKWSAIQLGHDFIDSIGEAVPNSQLTVAGPKNRRYAYLSDTRYNEQFFEYIQNVDLAYIESTYLKDEEQKARERFHLTTVQAAAIAKKCGISQLLLGHYSSQYKDVEQFKTQAQEVFENSDISIQGMSYDVTNQLIR